MPTFTQAGEQSTFDSRKNGGREALTPLSGAFSWNQTALARPTPGVAMDLRFGYSSANTTWQFAYNASNGLLERIVDPRDNTNVFVQYDQYGRKTNAVDALGRATRTEYNVPASRQMRNTDPGVFQWLETYDRKGHILAQQDPLSNATRYTYDEFGNRTSITEPLGWTTLFGYDDRANVIARTNALGEIARWVMHTNFNKAIKQITPQPPGLAQRCRPNRHL